MRARLTGVDLVHVHSNTWMNQVAARVARRGRRPYVLTHYGTEIWHHDGRDRRFRRLNRQASHVVYYSRALLERGRELGVPCRAASVIYPPVAETFGPMSPGRREEIRRRFVETDGLLLLNVKRLHPLADHATLLAAFAHVARQRPEARLLIAGSGERETRLRAQAAALGLEASVRFLGLVPNEEVAELQAAADLFVLSSTLEATPTVVLEALASGTPAVSTDNPGGLELHALFGDDVTVVPRSSPEPLAEAILTAAARPRRTRPETARRIEERFRPHAVVTAYAELYREALGT
jgi:glycosyltransferase involved in cell wall biosynthesis